MADGGTVVWAVTSVPVGGGGCVEVAVGVEVGMKVGVDVGVAVAVGTAVAGAVGVAVGVLVGGMGVDVTAVGNGRSAPAQPIKSSKISSPHHFIMTTS